MMRTVWGREADVAGRGLRSMTQWMMSRGVHGCVHRGLIRR